MRPDFWLRFESEDLTDKIRGAVLSISFTDKAGIESDEIAISLDDRLQLIEPPRTGVVIDLGLGYVETGVRSMGLFTVDEVRLAGMPNTIEISAKGADFKREIKEQKTRSYDKMKIGDIISEKASALGLKPLVDDALGNLTIDHIDQTNESDMHFITRLGTRYDAIAKPVNGFLTFQKRGAAKNSSGESPGPVHITLEECLSWNATVTDYPRQASVKARHYDKKAAKYIEKTSGSGQPAKTLRGIFPSEQEAQAAADAEMAASERSTGEVSASVFGNPLLRAEVYVIFSGLHRLIDKQWLINEARHEFGSSGYTTSITCGSETETASSSGGKKKPTPQTMTLEETLEAARRAREGR